MESSPLNPRIIGLSPLGNNLSDNGGVTESEVPLVFDPITGTWCAKLSKVNQEEREMAIDVARRSMEDQTFLGAVGYQQT